jgi:hypothetical protein
MWVQNLIAHYFPDNSIRTKAIASKICNFHKYSTHLKTYRSKMFTIDDVRDIEFKRSAAHHFFQNGKLEEAIRLFQKTLERMEELKEFLNQNIIRVRKLQQETVSSHLMSFLDQQKKDILSDKEALQKASQAYVPPPIDVSLFEPAGKKPKKKKKPRSLSTASTVDSLTTIESIEEDVLHVDSLNIGSLEISSLDKDQETIETFSEKDTRPQSKNAEKKQKRLEAELERKRKEQEELEADKQEREKARKAKKAAKKEQKRKAAQDAASIVLELESSDEEDDGIIVITDAPRVKMSLNDFQEKSSSAMEYFYKTNYDQAAQLFDEIRYSIIPYAPRTAKKDYTEYHMISNLYSQHKDRFFNQENFLSSQQQAKLGSLFMEIAGSYATDHDLYYQWREAIFMAARAYVNAAQTSKLEHYKVSQYLKAAELFNQIQDTPNIAKAHFCAAEEIGLSSVSNPRDFLTKTTLRSQYYLIAKEKFELCNDADMIARTNARLAIEAMPNPVDFYLEKNDIPNAKKRAYYGGDVKKVRLKVSEIYEKRREELRQKFITEDESI